MSRSRENRQHSQAASSISIRAIVAFVGPVVVALLASAWLSSRVVEGQPAVIPLLAALGIVSWLLGLRWYSLPEMGLRGGRPLFAGIGFAALGWVAFLALRFIFVRLLGYGGSFRTFMYLLLFEAFAVQLWTFGLVFRSFADWRGPLTAAVTSGILFGTVAFLFFQESFVSSVGSYLYFLAWGVLYGIIRLRTGSIMGIAVVQALQTFTVWVVLAPLPQPDASQLQTLYLVASLVYLVIIWRLWPKREEDYRV